MRRIWHGTNERKKRILGLVAAIVSVILILMTANSFSSGALVWKSRKADPIKWVDFNVSYKAMEKAMNLDIESYGTETHLNWIELLAYLGAKYGGDFSKYKESDMEKVAQRIVEGDYMAHIAKGMRYYPYYLEAYGAVLGGFVGEFTENGEEKYGLKAYSPIAEGYWYNDYDDFGAGRTYGYNRKHFGHDLMISTGTPVISVESGIVEALGWNQYGGWRIGIRSLDGKRYYYYAHLRKDRPYAAGLCIGKSVSAGDVIGYSGQTGYSAKENVNNIVTPHLHYGMQLIFNEEAKDSPNQIWVDLYAITRLLSAHRSEVVKNQETKEYTRKNTYSEPNPWNAELPEKEAASVQGKLSASQAPADSVAVPILMYHGLLKDPAMQSEFVISPSLFQTDLKYLKEHGYTTILMQDLIDFVREDRPLPEKPIILTFDDGYYNNYLYAYPLLKEYGMKAVISIIGSCTEDFSKPGADADHATYSHITWKQAREMMASGLVEIQNHSYDKHTYDKGRKGVKRKEGESPEAYRKVLEEDVGYLQKRIAEMTGVTPTTFAYPFGYLNDDSTDYMKELGFLATLSCSEEINYISKEQKTDDDLYNLKRILRPPDLTSKSFFEKWGIE